MEKGLEKSASALGINSDWCLIVRCVCEPDCECEVLSSMRICGGSQVRNRLRQSLVRIKSQHDDAFPYESARLTFHAILMVQWLIPHLPYTPSVYQVCKVKEALCRLNS